MKTALIIEDNSDHLTLMKDILELHGYKTIRANSGVEGIEIAICEQPDFILLDIQLPDIDGHQVLEMIRQNEKTQETPIVAITSYAMAGDKENLLLAGCDGYIEKPFDAMGVVRQIQEITGIFP